MRYALIGTYVGVIPVALGLLWYPFLRRLGTAGMNFVLALTVGLLAFLRHRHARGGDRGRPRSCQGSSPASRW